MKTQSETQRIHHTKAMAPEFCFSGGFCSTEKLVFTNERKQLFHDVQEILKHSEIASWKKRVVRLPHTGQFWGWGDISALPSHARSITPFPLLPVPEEEVRGPRVKIINIQARSFLFPSLGLGSSLLLSPPPIRQPCD